MWNFTITHNNTLIYKFDKNSFKKGNGLGKYEFYKEQNINPWNKKNN